MADRGGVRAGAAELVRGLYSDFDRRDMRRIREHLTDNVEFHNPAWAVEPGVRRGPDDFCAALEALHDMFEYESTELAQMTLVGDAVVVDYRMRARGRASGAPIDDGAGHVWLLREGRVARFEWFRDYAEALASVGP